jgi:1,2-phenylacetyl-CoA epoxidase catalytic subunit
MYCITAFLTSLISQALLQAALDEVAAIFTGWMPGYEFLKFASQQEVIAARWAIPDRSNCWSRQYWRRHHKKSRSLGITVCLIQDYPA